MDLEKFPLFKMNTSSWGIPGKGLASLDPTCPPPRPAPDFVWFFFSNQSWKYRVPPVAL